MGNNDQFQLQNVLRLGVMGGTFDPIHHGHLVLAETALHRFRLDKVAFIPCLRPPHKESQAELDAAHRAAMTELAIAGEPAFFLSRVELERGGYSYAYDTLVYLRELLPAESQIYFITGADSILEIASWRRAELLPSLCRFIAAGRPGYDLGRLSQLPEIYRQAVDFMETPQLDISSTDIRRRVGQGEPIKYLLPPAVEEYIQAHGLYQQGPAWDRMGFIRRVQAALSPKRYTHSLAVAELSQRWAAHWGLDQDRAYMAGLLHDIAREQKSERLIALAQSYGIPVDEVVLASPVILHAEVGAALVKAEWALEDPQILEAIARHTIPDPEMGPVAKVVYLADICEPNRRWWPGREILLDLCVQDLDQAMVFAMEQSLAYLQQKGQTPHPRTMQVLAEFRRRVRRAI